MKVPLYILDEGEKGKVCDMNTREITKNYEQVVIIENSADKKKIKCT